MMLRLDLVANEALLEQHEPGSEIGGEPIGTFRGPLPTPLAEQLRAVLPKTNFHGAPSTRGGPGSSLIRVRWSNGADTREAAVSSLDPTAMEPLDPLLEVLNDALAATERHPCRAVTLTVKYIPAAGGGTFQVTVKNVGTEPVALPDLLALGSKGADDQARAFGVRVAFFPPERPGFTPPPPDWAYLGMARAQGAGRAVVLAPGHEIVHATLLWTPAKVGERHFAQAVFANYEKTAPVEGHPPIRGRLLSKAIEVTPR
jgi:hypothetical protein